MAQTSSVPIRELARSYFDQARAGWEQGDVSGLDEVCTNDLVNHMPLFPDLNEVGLRNYITGVHQASPDFFVQVDGLVVDGDSTVQRWHCTATYSGHSSLLAVPPTGRSTRGTGVLRAHWRWSDFGAVALRGLAGWLTAAGVVSPLNATSAG